MRKMPSTDSLVCVSVSDYFSIVSAHVVAWCARVSITSLGHLLSNCLRSAGGHHSPLLLMLFKRLVHHWPALTSSFVSHFLFLFFISSRQSNVTSTTTEQVATTAAEVRTADSETAVNEREQQTYQHIFLFTISSLHLIFVYFTVRDDRRGGAHQWWPNVLPLFRRLYLNSFLQSTSTPFASDEHQWQGPLSTQLLQNAVYC